MERKDAPTAWLAEMGGYLKANDPYRHLVTNSYTTTGRPEQNRLAAIDLTQTHRYGDEGSIVDFAALIAEDTYAHDRFAKPHLMGEFDDGALMKAFGQAGAGFFPGPAVLADEICARYNVRCIGRVESIHESFWAITAERRVSHPAIITVMEAARTGLFPSGSHCNPNT